MSGEHESILILDFGSQYTQLIARRVRELNVFSEILPCDANLDRVRRPGLKGIVLSGGPQSVYDENAPSMDPEVYNLGVPVLGVCYGLQLMMRDLGGEIVAADSAEYGPASVEIEDPHSPMFIGLDARQFVWASHGDHISKPAPGFVRTASSRNAPFSALEDRANQRFGLQFHPEVHHTRQGREMLRNFVHGICGCSGDWSMRAFIDEAIEQVREQVGDGKVVCGLSGGVDSSVMALLLHRALGDRLTCIFVDNGLLRKGEADQVLGDFRERYHLEVRHAAAGERFLDKLAGVTEPERKRKIIGETFIEVFDEEAEAVGGVDFLAQGTIYPDRIESAAIKGPATTIKTHHNVGGLPDHMKLDLVEPLKDLFKDEVRKLGHELGLDPAFVGRHPFPGPGLAVRILGEITSERVRTAQDCDAIFIEELREAGLYDSTSQAFVVLLPVRTVGVMGDFRTYGNVVAIRAVETQDFMTADWARLPVDFLSRVSSRIVNEVREVNRVVYDITSKPPGTIEWE